MIRGAQPVVFTDDWARHYKPCARCGFPNGRAAGCCEQCGAEFEEEDAMNPASQAHAAVEPRYDPVVADLLITVAYQREQLRILNQAVARRNAQRRSHAKRYNELRAVAKGVSGELNRADVEQLALADKLDRVLKINKYAWRPDAPERT